jgi:hypothetical protein
MFLSPGGPGMLFFLLTLEGSSYLHAGCVSCIVHSKFDGLFLDSPEWSFPLISYICLCQGKVTRRDLSFIGSIICYFLLQICAYGTQHCFLPKSSIILYICSLNLSGLLASLSAFAIRSWVSDVSQSLTFAISSLNFSRCLTATLCSLSISFF